MKLKPYRHVGVNSDFTKRFLLDASAHLMVLKHDVGWAGCTVHLRHFEVVSTRENLLLAEGGL